MRDYKPPKRHHCYACDRMVEVPHDCPNLGMAFKTGMYVTPSQSRLSKVLDTLQDTAGIDMVYKNIFQLLASCTSELGELTDELLIKYRVFGTLNKKPDEGPRAEAVDLVISALAIYYAESAQEGLNDDKAQEELVEIMDKKLSKWVAVQKAHSIA